MLLFTVGVACVASEYLRLSGKIYIVSGLSDSVRVDIEDVGALDISRDKVYELPISEGVYRARIVENGVPVRIIELDLRRSFFERFSSARSLWILNIRGSALLLEELATYRTPPPPIEQTLHYGKELEMLTAVNCPFTPLPDSLRMHVVFVYTIGDTRTAISLVTGSHKDLTRKLLEHDKIDEALSMLEWDLRTFGSHSTRSFYRELGEQNPSIKARTKAFLNDLDAEEQSGQARVR